MTSPPAAPVAGGQRPQAKGSRSGPRDSKTTGRHELSRHARFAEISPAVGVLDEQALHRALADDPSYSMATLLRQVISAGAPPSLARLPMSPEQVAAAYQDIDEAAEDYGDEDDEDYEDYTQNPDPDGQDPDPDDDEA